MVKCLDGQKSGVAKSLSGKMSGVAKCFSKVAKYLGGKLPGWQNVWVAKCQLAECWVGECRVAECQ